MAGPHCQVRWGRAVPAGAVGVDEAARPVMVVRLRARFVTLVAEINGQK